MTLAELIAQQAQADAQFAALVAAQDYPSIAATLNAPTTVANPVTEPETVPHPPTLKEIYAIIPVAEAAAIYSKPGLSADIRNAIDSGDADYLSMMLAIVLEMEIISAQTATALAMLLQRTQPDPTWTATVSGPSLAQAAGVGTVTAAQVQAVAHA
jgi:hypothetical protein